MLKISILALFLGISLAQETLSSEDPYESPNQLAIDDEP